MSVIDLVRVSRFKSGEPHFHRGGNNRFDHPAHRKNAGYGSCYLAFDVTTAIAETVLHDEEPQRGVFRIAESELNSRYTVRFSGDGKLVLANLTGAALKTVVGHGEISTVTPYALPQAWALAIHDHSQAVDGLLYMARHVNDRHAVVLFDRAASKLGPPTIRRLSEEPDYARAVDDLCIVIEYV